MLTPTDHIRSSRRFSRAAVVPLFALLTCAALAACGGSSSPATATHTTTSAVATTSAAANATSAIASGAQTAHAGGATTGSKQSNGSGSGGSTPAGSANGSNGSSSVSSKYPPEFVAAVKSFTTCVRSHGLNLPEPNLSGHGEIFNRSSVNPSNPNYRSALQACEGDLIAILRAAGASHIKGLSGSG